MAIVIPGGSLTKLRAPGHHSKLYLAIQDPDVIYTARVDQTTFTDPIPSIEYDGGAGTLGNVKIGMTMWVGSAAGLYDRGKARIRDTPDADTFPIGLDSEVEWENNDYITIVDEIGLWAKAPTVSGLDIQRMDFNIGYTDQHDDKDPVPVLGPQAVLWLTGATVDFEPDASASWVLDAAIASFLWTAPDASATADLNTATPTITYDAAGTYRVGCTVTADSGTTATGYRYVFVFTSASMPIVEFDLQQVSGEWNAGGASFEVLMFGEADLASVRDEAMVILFSEDYYNGVAGSLGPIAGYENIIAIGWIDGESINWAPDHSEVTFAVRGPNFRMAQITSSAFVLNNSTGAPTDWFEFEDLTVDNAIWHLLHWRSTATAMMDVILTEDTRKAQALNPTLDTLWDQIKAIAEIGILAFPLTDRYGRFFLEIDSQFLATGDRAGIPTVITLEATDWTSINIERTPTNRTSRIDLQGENFDGTTATPLLSTAAGIVQTRHGQIEAFDRMLVNTQGDMNTLSGNILAQRNNTYKVWDIEMSQHNRFIDIAPLQYLEISITSGDTERGITLTNQKLIPRRWELIWDKEIGAFLTSIECEAETTGTDGQTVPYIPPPEIGTLPKLPPFTLEDFKLPALFPEPNPSFPPYIPENPNPEIDETEECPNNAPSNGPFPTYIFGTLVGDGNYIMRGSLAGYVRTAAHDNKTVYSIQGRFQKKTLDVWDDTNDDAWYEIRAVDIDGNVLATGVHDAVTGFGFTRTGTLNSAAVAKMAYIEIEIGDVFRPSVVAFATAENSGATPTPGTDADYPVGNSWVAKMTNYTWVHSHPIPGQIPSLELWITFGAPDEFLGQTIQMNQRTLWLREGGSNNGVSLQALHHTVGTPKWKIDYSPPSAGDLSNTLFEYNMEVSAPAPARVARIRTVLTCEFDTTGGPWRVDTEIQAFVDPIYRLLIDRVNIFNLCTGNA